MGNKTSSPAKPRESTDGLPERNKKSKGSSQDQKSRTHGNNTKSRVTKIARIAGKRWTQMNDEQRKKYIDLANAEKRRREERKRKRPNHNTKVKAKNKPIPRRDIN